MRSIEKIFNERIKDFKLNTSYPLHPADWTRYKVPRELPFEDGKQLSFYIHIPFCESICSFCEYTRMKCPDRNRQNQYIQTLENDIQKFIEQHPHLILRGFDIGGGTPTVLHDDVFARLMELYQKYVSIVPISPDFEPSIEGTFHTLSESKLKQISGAGIKRVSLGLQSTGKQVLANNSRTGIPSEKIHAILHLAKSNGIRKINLDLMYGLKGQTLKDIEADLSAISLFMPEQVTLYELRTNMLGIDNYMSQELLFDSYCLFYDGLKSLGYQGRFGQNTFSLDADDFGVSSYLRSRMLEGIPYKGFGIAAQSMSPKGISYNIGKNSMDLLKHIDQNTYKEQDCYQLPPDELAAKFIAISSYSGRFSLTQASAILEKDCSQYYKDEIDFCLNHGLMTLENDTLYITRDGFKVHGSVFSLFYPASQRQNWK